MKKLNISNIIFTIITISAPIFIPLVFNYNMFERGSSPPKKIEYSILATTDLLKDFSNFGDSLSISMSVDKFAITNLEIVQTTIHNTGAAPIAPSDFVENLSISVSAPWKIVGIVNTFPDNKAYIPLHWKKETDTKFVAETTLLNPNDYSWVSVYVTDPEIKAGEKKVIAPPKIEWGGRIINMLKFDDKNYAELLKKSVEGNIIPIFITLTGKGVIFLILCFIAFEAIYLICLEKTGMFNPWKKDSIIIICLLSILGLAAAESTTSYVIGSFTYLIIGIPFWWNAPWIALNALAMGTLVNFAVAGKRLPRFSRTPQPNQVSLLLPHSPETNEQDQQD